MSNPIILYHCKQISDGQTVREFQVVAASIESARTACVSVLDDAGSPTNDWGIEVYPLSSIAAVRIDPRPRTIYHGNAESLPAWGAK